MSLFVSFEGGEGCGKSTQARALYRRLSRSDIPAALVREPGSTPLGVALRRLVKHPGDTAISPLAELLLILASRAQLVNDVIRPNLARGTMVVCDRFADSTVAYQGYGRGIDLDTVQFLNRFATQGLFPDLVVLLDIPADLGLARRKPDSRDRFEREDLAFHLRVRQGYLNMAGADPQRWLVVDGTLPRPKIETRVWDRVRELLRKEGMWQARRELL